MVRFFKTIISTGFFVGFLFFSSTSVAQEPDQYYRYFEVRLSADEEREITSDLFRGTPFEVFSSCASKKAVLISVPSSYPKRVYQIEEELKESLQKAISSDNIQSLNILKASDLESFCQ